MRHLLDVNVWVALLDEAHVHHIQALTFAQRLKVKIATCPIIENGVIRILNLPGYSRLGPAGFETVRNKLQQICTHLDHEFWPDEVSLRTESGVNWSRVLGHNQITDIYLLALAVARKGCFVTLDHRVTLSTVNSSSSKNLMLL